MNNRELIDAYIRDHELAWAESTKHSERYRLLSVAEHIDGNPNTLWQAIQPQKPYSRVTLWTRVTKFWDYVKPGTENQYRTFRTKNARLFKHAYQKRLPTISLEEAKLQIASIKNISVQNKAYDLLCSGLRYSESFSVKDGFVLGKGGKVREVFGALSEGPEKFEGSYKTFWRHLNEVGLRPHDLRKIFASRLAKQGLNTFDLCRVMGWEHINTATSYVAASTVPELKKFVRYSVK